MEGSNIRIQDQHSVVACTTSSYIGLVITWKFVRNHWDELVQQNGLTGFTMRYIVDSCTVFQDDDDYETTLKFYKDRGIDEMKSIKRTMEIAKVRLDWYNVYNEEIKSILND